MIKLEDINSKVYSIFNQYGSVSDNCCISLSNYANLISDYPPSKGLESNRFQVFSLGTIAGTIQIYPNSSIKDDSIIFYNDIKEIEHLQKIEEFNNKIEELIK